MYSQRLECTMTDTMSALCLPPQAVVAVSARTAQPRGPQLLLHQGLRAGEDHSQHLLQADGRLHGQSLPQVPPDARSCGAYASAQRKALRAVRSLKSKQTNKQTASCPLAYVSDKMYSERHIACHHVK